MRRIVLKVGSAVLTQDGELALGRLHNLVEFIFLLKEKFEVILVSSGAVAAGYSLLQLDETIIVNKQVLAALGQPLLLHTYINKFSKYNMLCSQILLGASIFKDSIRLNHAREAIEVMLKNHIVPIINENDVTETEELVFGDNDQLSAYVTNYFNADLLVILSDIDGYYNKNPHEFKDAKLQKIVNVIDKKQLEQNHSANNKFAKGGIVTKLKAADFLIKNNKNMFLSTGINLTYIREFLLDNKHNVGTLFTQKGK
tara:strand:+ start:44 stop:811 length:768 start_codon:yes stop_codon:yes gene_type:complete